MSESRPPYTAGPEGQIALRLLNELIAELEASGAIAPGAATRIGAKAAKSARAGSHSYKEEIAAGIETVTGAKKA